MDVDRAKKRTPTTRDDGALGRRTTTRAREMHRVGKTFVKTTKRGQAVTKVRRERYLRDDVYVGCGDAAVEARYRGRDEALYVLRPERRGAKSERTIALIDSNVALHQMDALADARGAGLLHLAQLNGGTFVFPETLANSDWIRSVVDHMVERGN